MLKISQKMILLNMSLNWPNGVVVDINNGEFLIFKDEQAIKDTDMFGVTEENEDSFIHFFVAKGRVDFVTDSKGSELTKWVSDFFKA